MGSSMKKLFLFVLISFMLLFAAGVFTLTRNNIEDIIVCSSNESASYIPSLMCEQYLLNFRGQVADIDYLKQRTGLNFLANIENPQKRSRLFGFFLAKGMDVNAINNIDGLTPLHAAILLNDAKLADFLLQHGADKTIRDRTNNLTPLAFLEQMDRQLPGVDRSRLRQVLTQ